MAEPSHNSTQGTWPTTFKAAFCEHFRCPLERYETEVFWRSLFRHALPLAVVLWRLRPEFFEEDFAAIRELGECTSPQLFRHEINYFYGRNQRDKSWLRTSWSIRVSGNRLIKLRKRVFGE